MAIIADDRGAGRPPHPLHAVFLSFAFPLFLGALLSDVAYANSYQIQWANFAAWLIAGALLFSACALLWALVDVVRFKVLRSRRAVYAMLLSAMWILGLINAFVHARDGWAMMPTGLILSVITASLAFAASWIGYSGIRGIKT